MKEHNFDRQSWRVAYIERIDKRKANKLFEEEVTILILGEKLNPYCVENSFKHIIKQGRYKVSFTDLISYEETNLNRKWDGSKFRYYIIRKDPKEIRYKNFP